MTQASIPPYLRLIFSLTGEALGLPPSCGVDGEIDWEQFVQSARSHRVDSLVDGAITAAKRADVPEDAARALRREAMRSWIFSEALAQDLARVAVAFERESIPMAALKGPAAAAQAYPDPGRRAMHDLDILIRPCDVDRAHEVLEASGFECVDPAIHLAPHLRDAFLTRTAQFGYTHRQLSYLLELHTAPMHVEELLPISVDKLIGEAEECLIAGAPVPALSPWAQFLLVTIHGAYHAWYRLHWLTDFVAYLTRYPQWFGGAPDEADARWADIDALGLQDCFGAAFEMARIVFGVEPPAALIDRLAVLPATRPMAEYGVRSLVRNAPPMGVGENLTWARHMVRLRRDWRSRAASLLWHMSPTYDEIMLLPLTERLAPLYPLLKLALWPLRKSSRPAQESPTSNAAAEAMADQSRGRESS